MSKQRKMTNTTQTIAENFWIDFQALSKNARKAVIERLLHDEEFRQDLIDIATLERQNSEDISQPASIELQEESIVRKTKGIVAEVKEFVKEIADDESIYYSD